MTVAENRFLSNLAKTVSVFFHPLFMPLYGLFIIFSAPTLLAFIPFRIKRIIFLIAAINNVIMPMSVILILYSRGILKTFFASEKKERTIILSLTMILYFLSAILMLKMPVPNLVRIYFLAITVITFVSILINLFWSMSIHSVAVGSLLALVCFISYLFEVSLVNYIAAVIFLSGLVMFSRLYNADHKPGEVWAGFMAGVGAMALSLLILL